MSQIPSASSIPGVATATASSVAGAPMQSRVAARDRDKKISEQRDRRDAVLDLEHPLDADRDGDDKPLIDQELPDQGPPLPPETMAPAAEIEDESVTDTEPSAKPESPKVEAPSVPPADAMNAADAAPATDQHPHIDLRA